MAALKMVAGVFEEAMANFCRPQEIIFVFSSNTGIKMYVYFLPANCVGMLKVPCV
jgi:hypothetical protein